MFSITRLETENFGVYRGKQVLEIPSGPGVTIIYGENQRGKTTLLNAIRFGLFGKALGRGAKPIPIPVHELCNWESVAAGEYSFGVVLHLIFDGVPVQITRRASPLSNASRPTKASDYAVEVIISRDGHVLPREDGIAELKRILPEAISRFFLFDGELLQEYEELLREESKSAATITEAIETILGVPILKHARDHMLQHQRLAQASESRALQADLRTREIGKILETQLANLKYHQDEVETLQKQTEELKREKAIQEGFLRENELVESLLDEVKQIEADMKAVDNQVAEKKTRLQEACVDVWRGVLGARVRSVREQLTSEISGLLTTSRTRYVKAELSRLAAQAVDSRRCALCEQTLDDSKVHELISEYSVEPLEHGEDDRLFRLIGDLVRLQDFEQGNVDLVREISADIDRLLMRRATREGKLNENQVRLQKFPHENIREARLKYDQALQKIAINEQTVRDYREKIKGFEASVRDLLEKKDRLAGRANTNDGRKRELFTRLYDVFREGVDKYAEHLRKQVQHDATRYFTALTTEQDFIGVEIATTYGLRVLERRGRTVERRSAGGEHVVALSLIAALQRNAPMSGPLVMDSPFGRLDNEHTRNIIEALPTMADQVILLVFERELDATMAAQGLGGKLLVQYHLRRVSAFHTTIVKGLGE